MAVVRCVRLVAGASRADAADEDEEEEDEEEMLLMLGMDRCLDARRAATAVAGPECLTTLSRLLGGVAAAVLLLCLTCWAAAPVPFSSWSLSARS